MRFPREFYIPKAAEQIVDPKSDAVAYIQKGPTGKLEALGFVGKRQKPNFHYTFKNAARLQEHVVKFFEDRRSTLTFKAEQKAKDKAKRAAGHGYKVGDILSSSWGYEQTNVDFYQVVALNGKTMLTLQAIAQREVECVGYMSGKTFAVAGSFTGEPFKCRVNAYGSVKVSSCASASKWDGKPKSYSSYH